MNAPNRRAQRDSSGQRPTVAQAISHLTLTVTRGVGAGLFAGIPQVLIAQGVGALLGYRDQADIGPRFLTRAARHTGAALSSRQRWLLSTIFHFEYAAAWGALYALFSEGLHGERLPAPLRGAALGALIYTAAFSNIGAATQTGAVAPQEARPVRTLAVQGSAALSFALVLAYAHRWTEENWA